MYLSTMCKYYTIWKAAGYNIYQQDTNMGKNKYLWLVHPAPFIKYHLSVRTMHVHAMKRHFFSIQNIFPCFIPE